MIYAVIDTNVFVAALLTKSNDSATVKVYDAIADGLITLLYHKDILEEYAEVLSRPKFKFSRLLSCYGKPETLSCQGFHSYAVRDDGHFESIYQEPVEDLVLTTGSSGLHLLHALP